MSGVPARNCEALNDELKKTNEFLRLPFPEALHRIFNFPTDVVIKGSDGLGVPAHSVILATRSPVFSAMLLQSNMEETRTGIINMDDVSQNALRGFVEYLYTAKVSLDVELALPLLALADKYQVNLLHSNCQDFLISKLTIQNALTLFAHASRHNASRLRKFSMILFMENFESCKQQEEYEILVDSDPKAVVRMFEEYLDYKDNRKYYDCEFPAQKKFTYSAPK